MDGKTFHPIIVEVAMRYQIVEEEAGPDDVLRKL